METHLAQLTQEEIDAADTERAWWLAKIFAALAALYLFVYVVTYFNADEECMSRGASSTKVSPTLKVYCVVAGMSAPLEDIKRLDKTFPRR